jgi:hypothetical protein
LHSFEPVQTAESAMNIAMVGISVFIFFNQVWKIINSGREKGGIFWDVQKNKLEKTFMLWIKKSKWS